MTLQVEYLPASSLIPYARNMNKHSDQHIAEIAASIKEFGWTIPILVDAENSIVAGHGRVLAAQKLGIDTVPVLRRDNWTKEQIKAYRIADNRLPKNADVDTPMLTLELQELKGAEFELGLLGFEPDELDALLNPEQPPSDGLTDPDEVPEQVETRCKPGDLWILGNHRLLCGDSTNVQHVERLMGEKADLWLTDPPYGVDIKQVSIDRYEKTGRGGTQARHKEIANDVASASGWKEVLRDAFSNAHLATTEKASHYVFTCQGSDKQMMMMMMMQEAGWNFRHEIIWLKNRFILGRSDYHYQHEPCLYGWKESGTHEWFGERDKSSVLEFDVSKNDLHPTMKPVGLIEQLVTNSSRPKGKVLDTFSGSGSTLIACEKTGRRCFGMEIDPKYADVILTRWEQFTGKTAVLEA